MTRKQNELPSDLLLVMNMMTLYLTKKSHKNIPLATIAIRYSRLKTNNGISPQIMTARENMSRVKGWLDVKT